MDFRGRVWVDFRGRAWVGAAEVEIDFTVVYNYLQAKHTNP